MNVITIISIVIFSALIVSNVWKIIVTYQYSKKLKILTDDWSKSSAAVYAQIDEINRKDAVNHEKIKEYANEYYGVKR